MNNYPQSGHQNYSSSLESNNSSNFGASDNFQQQQPQQQMPPQQSFGSNRNDYSPLEIQCSSQQQQQQPGPPSYYGSANHTPGMQQMDVEMDQHRQHQHQHSSYGHTSQQLQPPPTMPPRRTVSFSGIPPLPPQHPHPQQQHPQQQQQQQHFMHQPQNPLCSPQLHPHQQQQQQQQHTPPTLFNMESGPSQNNNNNGYLHPSQQNSAQQDQQHSPFDNFNNNVAPNYSMPPQQQQQQQMQHPPPPLQSQQQQRPPQFSHHPSHSQQQYSRQFHQPLHQRHYLQQQQSHPPPMRKFSYQVTPQHSGFLENYPPQHPPPNDGIYRAHSTVNFLDTPPPLQNSTNNNSSQNNNQNNSQNIQPPQNWRKMSLAPNFKMNSTYGGEFEEQKPLQRTPSQALDFQKRKLSLRRFSSQLRTPRMVPGSNPMMLSLTPYTPPPILSPIRNGTGLFCKIARKPSEFRKRSTIFDMATDVIMEEDIPSASGQDIGIADDLDQGPSPLTPEGSISDEKANNNSSTKSNAPPPFIRPPIDNRANRPQRKNGLFLSGQETTSTGFVAELEALRKESAESSMSGKSIEALQARYIQPRKCSTLASTSNNNEDVIRKMSSVSMDEPIISNRKISTMSEAYYDYTPCESDITPHINLGKQFQARVKKWADREIMPHEREAIPDRDECVFDCNVIEHLDEQTVAAYEALACSAAVPKIGHNKELALHILMENKGNIQASVMDLLRSDTLDWEDFPIIYNYRYSHVEDWTPDDIQSFQDAIYKSEKDFHQVSVELGNRTVKECIEFYYMWKKTCPDDYRKLRNLRRKRHLLEQQIDYSSVSKATPFIDHPMEESSEDEPESESDTDIGTPMYASDRSPDDVRPAKMPRLHESSPSPSERKISAVRFAEPEKPDLSGLLPSAAAAAAMAAANGLSLYPWLHGENGVFPSASPSSVGNSAGTGQSYSQPPSVGNNEIFSTERIPAGFNPDILQAKIANIHRVTASKKGAQPSADGYFHCRLCDKRFEKVKSLNAHMKSHAMKARAEAEANGSQPNPSPRSQPSHATKREHHNSTSSNTDRQQSQGHHGSSSNLLGTHLDALNFQQQLNAVNASAAAAVASVNNSLPNSMAGSPLSLGHHLSRMTQQFGAPMGLGSNTNALQNLPPGMNMSMFSPDMLTAMHQLANLPQHNGNLSTSAAASSALQQLHNNLQQHSATIIN
jgi:hypothetical protein